MPAKRIYFAADEKLLGVLGEPLRRAGLVVETFTRQVDLVPAARIDPPDALLLGARLPDGTALTAYRAIRAHAEVPTLVILATSQLPARGELLRAGVADVAVSPIRPKSLAARLAELAGGVRRGESREAIAVPCVAKAPGFEARGTTLDVSKEGLGIALGQPVSVGRVLELHLTPGGGPPLTLFGRVLHCRPDGDRFVFGMRLLALAPDEEQRLLALARETPPPAPPPVPTVPIPAASIPAVPSERPEQASSAPLPVPPEVAAAIEEHGAPPEPTPPLPTAGAVSERRVDEVPAEAPPAEERAASASPSPDGADASDLPDSPESAQAGGSSEEAARIETSVRAEPVAGDTPSGEHDTAAATAESAAPPETPAPSVPDEVDSASAAASVDVNDWDAVDALDTLDAVAPPPAPAGEADSAIADAPSSAVSASVVAPLVPETRDVSALLEEALPSWPPPLPSLESSRAVLEEALAGRLQTGESVPPAGTFEASARAFVRTIDGLELRAFSSASGADPKSAEGGLPEQVAVVVRAAAVARCRAHHVVANAPSASERSVAEDLVAALRRELETAARDVKSATDRALVAGDIPSMRELNAYHSLLQRAEADLAAAVRRVRGESTPPPADAAPALAATPTTALKPRRSGTIAVALGLLILAGAGAAWWTLNRAVPAAESPSSGPHRLVLAEPLAPTEAAARAQLLSLARARKAERAFVVDVDGRPLANVDVAADRVAFVTPAHAPRPPTGTGSSRPRTTPSSPAATAPTDGHLDAPTAAPSNAATEVPSDPPSSSVVGAPGGAVSDSSGTSP